LQEEDYDKFYANLPTIVGEIRDGGYSREEYEFELNTLNEGILIPGKVQYVAKGYNFRRLGYKYRGGLQVLRTIISLDYLWNRVRVQGGAYGSFATFSRNGNIYFSSYRDPNLKETLSVFDEASEYIREFSVDSRQMDKYIIGTISRLDTPLTPSMKGEEATSNYIRHITQEDIQSERDGVLSIRQEEIREFANMISSVMKQNLFCVVGDEERLKSSSDIFNELIQVFS
ncbi:MAG: insulinase family protein, partial [Nitrospirae bacterium]